MLMGEVTPKTALATPWLVVVPSPNCPVPFCPQHWTAPFARIAQEKSLPLTTCVASSRSMTPTGRERAVVVPSPTWPPLFVPQQATAPDESDTQLCWPPAASPVEVDHSPSEANELLGNDPAQVTMSDSQAPDATWKADSQLVAAQAE
jgi:hypothetical protein